MRSLPEIIEANRRAEEKEKRNRAEDLEEKAQAKAKELCDRCAEPLLSCICLGGMFDGEQV